MRKSGLGVAKATRRFRRNSSHGVEYVADVAFNIQVLNSSLDVLNLWGKSLQEVLFIFSGAFNGMNEIIKNRLGDTADS